MKQLKTGDKIVKVFLLCLLLLASPAAAQPQWTPAEKAELQKLGAIRRELDGAQVALANVYKDFTAEPRRQEFKGAMISGVNAEWACGQAARHLLNVGQMAFPPFGTASRETIITRGVGYANSCISETLGFGTRLQALGFASMATTGARLIAASAAATPFQSLLFTPLSKWQPVSYPRVVGPHGDYNLSGNLGSQGALVLADLDFLRARKVTMVMYGNAPSWPPTPHTLIANHWEILRYGADYNGLIFRVLMLEGGAAHPADEALVNADFAAGSGDRTLPFFVPLVGNELNSNMLGTGVQTNWHGRPLQAGANAQIGNTTVGVAGMHAGYTKHLQELLTTGVITPLEAFNRSFAVNYLPAGPAEFIQLDAMQNGWLHQALHNTSTSWEGSQAYDEFVFQFLHLPPPRPPAPPAGLTCGTGTHVEGTSCVANPCPPDSDFMLEVVPNADGKTAAVRCVVSQ